MKIVELNAIEFGCLKNRKITLSSGMNIIYGSNEAGKSTLLLFIKFMLYGLPKGKTAEKERAFSRDGHRAAGTMTVLHGGKRYIIERNSVAGSRSEHLKITDADTGETVNAEPWELLVGVPAEAFESSCCISQMKAADISRKGAASAIENMLVSADESIDTEKVIARLDAVRKEYKLNRGEGGLLHEENLKIAELKDKQRKAQDTQLLLNEKNERLARRTRELSELEEEYRRSEQAMRQIRAVELLNRFDRLDALKSERETLKRDMAAIKPNSQIGTFTPDENHVAELKNAYFVYRGANEGVERRQKQYDSLLSPSENDLSQAELGEKVEAQGGVSAVLSRVNALEKKIKSKKLAGALLIAIGAVCLAVGAMMFARILFLAVLCTAGAAAAAAGTAVIVTSKKTAAQIDVICSEYGTDRGGLEDYLTKCAAVLSEVRTAAAEKKAASERLEDAKFTALEAEERLVGLIEKTARVTDRSHEALRALTIGESDKINAECKARRELNVRLEADNRHIAELETDLAKYDRESLRASLTVDPSAVTPDEVKAAERSYDINKQKRDALDRDVRTLREEIISLKAGISQSPLEIADRIGVLEAKLKHDEEYYEALMLAKSSIEEASASMSGNVTPEISRRAGEILSSISKGAHLSLQTNKSLDVSVEQDGFLVSSELLSGGTRDAAYIALRIALMSRMFGGELPPIMLDEALCQLDDGRAESVISVLAQLPEKPQSLIFTCHRRETLLCEKIGTEYSEINL